MMTLLSYKTRQSYGLAICKMFGGSPKILLCRKRLTYEFIEFVMGKYSVSDWTKIIDLFDKMTHDEKLYILSNNSSMMWWKLMLNNEIDNPRFKRGLKRFYELDKERLGKVVADSVNGMPIWEMPKGRPNSEEIPYETAIREVEEEIKMTPLHYNLLFDHMDFSTRDYGITYRMRFFIAEAMIEPKNTFKALSSCEIDALSWCGMDDIARMPKTPFNTFLIKVLERYIELKSE